MTATVYIITRGSYDDYRIVGVATSRARAEALIEPLRGDWYYSDARVESYPLDILDKEVPVTEVTYPATGPPTWIREWFRLSQVPEDRLGVSDPSGLHFGTVVDIYYVATGDPVAGLKVAEERRTR